ncbi:MAG TPA: hypothetical protein VGO47_14485 [Chlamydiales bacterium]|nr:hypothetical protein [Chlamydiales bacterium]
MSMHALFQFFVRAMLQLVVFLISQLPEEMNVRVNSDMFLSSFEMQPSPHDTPQSPQPWALAPGWKSKPVLDSMGHPTGHYELVSNKFQRQAVESRLEQRDTYYRWHYISTAADLVQKFSSESSSTPSTSKKSMYTFTLLELLMNYYFPITTGKLQNKKSSNSGRRHIFQKCIDN